MSTPYTVYYVYDFKDRDSNSQLYICKEYVQPAVLGACKRELSLARPALVEMRISSRHRNGELVVVVPAPHYFTYLHQLNNIRNSERYLYTRAHLTCE